VDKERREGRKVKEGRRRRKEGEGRKGTPKSGRQGEELQCRTGNITVLISPFF
jgi:hypothetical protein